MMLHVGRELADPCFPSSTFRQLMAVVVTCYWESVADIAVLVKLFLS